MIKTMFNIFFISDDHLLFGKHNKISIQALDNWNMVMVSIQRELISCHQISLYVLFIRVRATRGYATPATRGTSLGPPQRLPWPIFSKNKK
jgi:hypothetical protein